ncbi:hypothetical protein F0L17_25675 [Streptomyces sp. TRM43335]|uniref:Uncharacterized protein n=1 Tax=Streptomyces taklimakanensis TaxID=2569853 RepID=A0A6G2BJK6_9ACTN|nr:hypothetical protein [Streptomyces taklimakanensis]MTE22430.1 hypothetical protein [Streptomyces taklimakanensis]
MAPRNLQIDEDERFQRGEWAFERGAWVVLTMIVVAALASLFGGLGIFHSERASAASGAVTVEYPGLTRYTATTELQITTGTAAVSEGEVMLTLSSDWVDGADIDRVTPEPDTWESTSDGLRLTFPAEQAPPEVQVSYRPDVIGLHSGTVTVGESGPEVGFRQFVYP